MRFLLLPKQAKDRQKKKSGAKGIRIDAEGTASLEDLANPELQDNDFDPHDPEKAKSSNKKVRNLSGFFENWIVIIF